MSRDRDDGAWFAPKRYGYGTGLPVAWQGWALLIGFLGLVAALAATLAERHPEIFIPLMLLLAAGFTLIAAQRTRGGWRWRWGDPD